MLTIITEASLGDVKRELSRMLAEAAQDMDVRNFALSITPSYEEDQISAVHRFVKSNISYQPDLKGSELFIAPRRMIEMIQMPGLMPAGDCDDIALFCASLYRVLGYESRIVLLDIEGDGFDHAVCEVKSLKLKEWVMVDPTVSDPIGWIRPYNKRAEVN